MPGIENKMEPKFYKNKTVYEFCEDLKEKYTGVPITNYLMSNIKNDIFEYFTHRCYRGDISIEMRDELVSFLMKNLEVK